MHQRSTPSGDGADGLVKHVRNLSTGGFSGRTEEAVGSTRDQEVRIIRGGDPELREGARLVGRFHVPGQHRSDPLVRVLIQTKRLVALRGNERKLLVLSLVLVAHVRAALCVLPSRFIVRLVRRLGDAPARTPRARRPAIDRVAWAIATASRVVPRATCLTQAVSGMLLLRHYGYESRLRLGVARSDDGGFLAHAWIEREGVILIGGPQSAAFTPLPALDLAFRENPTVGAP